MTDEPLVIPEVICGPCFDGICEWMGCSFPLFCNCKVHEEKAAHRQYRDPMDKVATPETRSYLGRFSENGWSIMIVPALSDAEWEQYSLRSDQAWDSAIRDYSITKAFNLLRELFPNRELRSLMPAPTKEKQ